MSDWISKAANVFKREVSETPQPFEVFCECEQRHSGFRRSRHQHLVCKVCGTSLFVLPRNVYPPPHVPKETKKTKTSPAKPKKSRVAPVAHSPSLLPPVDDDSPETDSPENRTTPSTDKKRRKKKATAPEIQEPPRPNVLVRGFQSITSFIVGLIQLFIGFWTPYRLISLVIVCLLLTTGYWAIRQSTLSRASANVKSEMEAGLAAIEERDWIDARQHFDIANDAVDQLGRTDVEANSIRQYYRETRAVTRLSGETLFDLLDDAEQFYVENGHEELQTTFSTNLSSDWYVIDGLLRTVDGHPTRKELVFPWTVGKSDREVRIEVDFQLADFSQGAEPFTSSTGEPAIFSGQVLECVIDSDSSWVVRFNPETAFLWTNLATYRATNLDIGSLRTSDELNALLNQQAIWMRVAQ